MWWKWLWNIKFLNLSKICLSHRVFWLSWCTSIHKIHRVLMTSWSWPLWTDCPHSCQSNSELKTSHWTSWFIRSNSMQKWIQFPYEWEYDTRKEKLRDWSMFMQPASRTSYFQCKVITWLTNVSMKPSSIRLTYMHSIVRMRCKWLAENGFNVVKASVFSNYCPAIAQFYRNSATMLSMLNATVKQIVMWRKRTPNNTSSLSYFASAFECSGIYFIPHPADGFGIFADISVPSDHSQVSNIIINSQ